MVLVVQESGYWRYRELGHQGYRNQGTDGTGIRVPVVQGIGALTVQESGYWRYRESGY